LANQSKRDVQLTQDSIVKLRTSTHRARKFYVLLFAPVLGVSGLLTHMVQIHFLNALVAAKYTHQQYRKSTVNG